MARRRMPRLTLTQWKACGGVAALLAAADQSLQGVKWGGAPSVRASIAQAYELLAALFNAGEPAALQHPSIRGAEPAQDAPQATIVKSDPDYGGNAAPGEPQREG